jgi:tetratricopeptide (TPR) repeat protein
MLGDSYVDGKNSKRPEARQLRVNMYENAINLNPRRLAAYHRLTEALLILNRPRDEDAKFLSIGLRAFPGEDWIRVGVAFVDYRLGRRDIAMAALENALRPESTLDGLQRTNATNLRRSFLVEEMNVEIEAAIDKRDFAGARATVARYGERIGTDSDVKPFLEELDKRLEMGEDMMRFEDALRARKPAEARALARQLLARPDLPKQMRAYVEDGLSRIN